MYQAADIAEFALRFCGVTTIYDTAPDPEQFSVALDHFNLLLAEKTGTKAHWWNTPGEQEISLDVGVSEYALDTLLSDDEPLMMVTDVHLVEDSTQHRRRLTLIRRYEFDECYNATLDTGVPEKVYIERKDAPALFILPTPVLAGHTLLLTGLKYPVDITADSGNIETGFPDAWARWLSLETACDIGSGAVIALSPTRIARLEKMAMKAEKALNRFNNRENLQGARFTKPRSF